MPWGKCLGVALNWQGAFFYNGLDGYVNPTFSNKDERWVDQHLTKLATGADATEIYINRPDIDAHAVRNKNATDAFFARTVARPNGYGLGGNLATKAHRIFRDVLWQLLGSGDVYIAFFRVATPLPRIYEQR